MIVILREVPDAAVASLLAAEAKVGKMPRAERNQEPMTRRPAKARAKAPAKLPASGGAKESGGAPAETRETAGGRERLFLAAIRLFGTKGYAATSVRDIVQAAGVTPPTLYHHFGSKEGLYLAMVRAGRDLLEKTWKDAIDAGGPVSERIRRLCHTHFGRKRQVAHLAWAVGRIMSEPMQYAPSIDFRALALVRIRQFERLVEEGVKSGEFRRCAPRHVALALVGAVEAASQPFWGEPNIDRREEELEGVLTVILSGIARRAPGRRASRSG